MQTTRLRAEDHKDFEEDKNTIMALEFSDQVTEKAYEDLLFLRFNPTDMIANKYFGKATDAFFLEVGYDSVYCWGIDFKDPKARKALKTETSQLIKNVS